MRSYVLAILIYHIIRSRDRYTYMASLQHTDFMDIESGSVINHTLSDSITDELCSISFKGYTDLDVSLRHEILLNMLYQSIKEVWNWSDGVPVIRIKGQTSLFPAEYRNRTIVPYFLRSNDTVDMVSQYTHWNRIIQYVPKLTMLYSNGKYSRVVIKDPRQIDAHMKAILKQQL